MTRLWQLLLVVLVLVIGGLVCWWGKSLTRVAGHGTEEILRIDPVAKHFGETSRGKGMQVSFVIENRSARPVQLLGSADVCTEDGCIKALTELPVEIPAKESFELALVCYPSKVGPYKGEITIYTSRPGQTEVVLTVEGEVVK